MNNEILAKADEAYKGGDYTAALQAFTECLESKDQAPEPGELGLLYHRIGNCLVKLGDYNEALHAFAQATADTAYAEMGSVNFNMGMAYAVLKDYEDAVRHFELAVSDNHYATPYKAYMGMGNALLRLGKSAEAGAAFRSAALDEANPNPAKSLLNLGVCFMALDRPSDAVTSYESALQFDMPDKMRNQIYANLGQAYVASNEYQKAVNAFEQSLADKTYFLNDAASVDYQQAIAQVSTGTAQKGETGKVDTSGLDVPAADAPQETSPVDAPEAEAQAAPSHAAGGPGDQPTESIPPVSSEAMSEERFFNATDEELERWSRAAMKEQRKQRGIFRKIVLFLLVLVVLLGAAGAFAYTQGYGWPTQEQITQKLFADPDNSSALFAPGVSQDEIDQMTKFVVQDSNVKIDGVNRSMEQSEVFATTSTSEGADVQYKVSFDRDMASWKITNVELNFASNDK